MIYFFAAATIYSLFFTSSPEPCKAWTTETVVQDGKQVEKSVCISPEQEG